MFCKLKLKNGVETIAEMSDDDAADIIECINKDKVSLECLGDIPLKVISSNDEYKYSDVIDLTELNIHTSSLEDVYMLLFDLGLDNNIHTIDELYEFCKKQIENHNDCSVVLKSIEDNEQCAYFGYNIEIASNKEAKPLYSIEKMIEYIL